MASMVAFGSKNQRIRIVNFSGGQLSTIRYHDGFLGLRIAPVTALAFHPLRPLLAAGGNDSTVSIFSPPDK